jgi:hypothetical protein
MMMVKKSVPYPKAETPGEERVREETAAYCHWEMMRRLWDLEEVLRTQAFWKGMQAEHMWRTVSHFLQHAEKTPLFEVPYIGNEPMPECPEPTPEQLEREREALTRVAKEMEEMRERHLRMSEAIRPVEDWQPEAP